MNDFEKLRAEVEKMKRDVEEKFDNIDSTQLNFTPVMNGGKRGISLSFDGTDFVLTSNGRKFKITVTEMN